ncbi:MAG TPA: class I SAM-dependent methyltransferase [Clostridia bacterium]|nr:class I SAM-dependent methyltransferase [Clostridia bacterium]
MKLAVLVVTALLLLAVVVSSQRRGTERAQAIEKPPMGRTDAEKRILGVIDDARRSGRVHLEVPDTDGRMLRVFAESINAKEAVEIGTSTGYSGLWLSLALQTTGGKLTTFEIDAGRAAQARKHFQQAGVDGIVTVIEGDAHKNLQRVKGPVDLVFIDAEKEGYPDYLKQMLPKVRPGGLILAHNIDMAPEYVTAVTTNPELETVFYMEGRGLGITLKKR